MELNFPEMARLGLEIADLLEASEAENKRLREALQHIKRTSEMSANLMRDTQRTGGWRGAERVAEAFERISSRAEDALFDVPNAPATPE
jgi:hypothetical protein